MTHISDHTSCVLAIGNFDGVHTGHVHLLNQAKDIAQTQGLPLHVLTFAPHPRAFFAPNLPPFCLTTPVHREKLLLKSGVNKVITLSFDENLAQTTAPDFVTQILQTNLAAKHVVVGQDFHFGANRQGTVETLSQYLPTTPIALLDGVSSSKIRDALTNANIELANQMLGWNWFMEGQVVHGDKRGREIGFPTANIPFTDTLCPAYGIYAVWVDIGDGKKRAGAANIGLRPMFALEKPLLEVHLFDFEGDLYGKTLKVEPVKRLRGEEKFNSLDELILQISNDCAAARDILICPA